MVIGISIKNRKSRRISVSALLWIWRMRFCHDPFSQSPLRSEAKTIFGQDIISLTFIQLYEKIGRQEELFLLHTTEKLVFKIRKLTGVSWNFFQLEPANCWLILFIVSQDKTPGAGRLWGKRMKLSEWGDLKIEWGLGYAWGKRSFFSFLFLGWALSAVEKFSSY